MVKIYYFSQLLTWSIRGVHGSVRVGFVPNPELTRRHRVSGNKIRRRPQTPTGQVRSVLFDRRSDRLKSTMMLPKIPFWRRLYFSPDLRWICAKITRSKQKNIKLSPDFCKSHEIWAKVHQIVVGFEQIRSEFRRIWAKPIIFSTDLSLIWAKSIRL